MADYYCDNGFAHYFHFRNMSPPIKQMRLKLSTLNSRVLGLFDMLPDSNYKNLVDNLHASINVVVQQLKHKVYVMLEGVLRKGDSGFLDMHKQEEVKGDNNIREAMGTIKALNLWQKVKMKLLQLLLSMILNPFIF